MHLSTNFVCGAIVVMLAVSECRAAAIQGLGDLSGGPFASEAYGVSADGSTVTGVSFVAYGSYVQRAFRWTEQTGMVSLGEITDSGLFQSRGNSISGDGSTIVGYIETSARGMEAFRWNSTTGFVPMGDLPGGYFESRAFGASHDGTAIVGFGSPGNVGDIEPFHWTSATGMARLKDSVGGFPIFASGVSADGSVIVGYGYGGPGFSLVEAKRWTIDGATTNLGFLPGDARSQAFGVSPDGMMVVGYSGDSSGPNREAFLWNESSGMIGLGDLDGGTIRSEATAVSGNGSVVVGWSLSSLGEEAFYWDATHGMRSLVQVLSVSGVDMSDWQKLSHASAITPDGKTIVGYGTNVLGHTEAFIATVPESGVCILILAGVVAFATFGRCMRRASVVVTVGLSHLLAQPGVSAELKRGDIIVHTSNAILAVDPVTGQRQTITDSGIPGPQFGGADGYVLETDPKTGTIYYSYPATSIAYYVGRVDPATGTRTVVSGTYGADTVGSGPLSVPLDVSVLPSGDIVAGMGGSIVRIDPTTGDRTLVPTSGATGAYGDVLGNYLFGVANGDVRRVDLSTGEVVTVSDDADWTGSLAGLDRLAIASPTTAYALALASNSIVRVDLLNGDRELLYEVPAPGDDPFTFQNFNLWPPCINFTVDANGNVILGTGTNGQVNLVSFDPVLREFDFISGIEMLPDDPGVLIGSGSFDDIRSVAIYLPEASSLGLVFGGAILLCLVVWLRAGLGSFSKG